MSPNNLDLDTRLLSEYVYALNIARRQVAAYPPGHPMITSAADKLLALQEKLLEFRRELTIGIARDSLLVDNKQLDPANPVYRDLASNLFNARVASLTVQSGATARDVRLLFEVLAYPGERIAAAGGLTALFQTSGVQGFTAREIDYRAFHATEVEVIQAPKTVGGKEDSAVLWKAFASAMVGGTIDPRGVRELPQGHFDPVLLAEAMNREQETGKGGGETSYEQAIADFVMRSNSHHVDDQSRLDLYDRLGVLIEQLSPELRRRLLNSTLQGLSTTPEQARELLGTWSHTMIVDALEQVETGQLQVPRILLDILGKLGSQNVPAESRRQAPVAMAGNRERAGELVSKLFREGQVDSFVPDDYSDALSVLAAAEVSTSLEPAQVETLLDNLNGHALERQFCAILLDLLEHEVGSQSVASIKHNLGEMTPYFLESGDFSELAEIYERLLLLRDKSPHAVAPAVSACLDIFAGEEFITQVLDGLDQWGKDLYPDIREMIGRIGVPFVNPLLDRLAEEPVMARRRLYMECLQRIGTQALVFVVGRLHDPRWYVVRNLVILLRELNDPEALRPLSRLFSHPHPKVQHEVIRTLLHFKDPRADRYLLHELRKGGDDEFMTGVVRLAANSRSSEVAMRLAELLNERANTESELALKRTIIASLAEMHCVQSLPALGAFIEGRSLLMSKSLQKLKLEAVASLARYPGTEAVELLVRLSQKAGGEIAHAAERLYLQARLSRS